MDQTKGTIKDLSQRFGLIDRKIVFIFSLCFVCVACADDSRSKNEFYSENSLAGESAHRIATVEAGFMDQEQMTGGINHGVIFGGEQIAGEQVAGERAGEEAVGGESIEAGSQNLSCESYALAQTYSELSSTELSELSGLTPSRRYPNLLWAHNDSGHAPILYAVHISGVVIATLELPHPHPERMDFEDIDTAPCPHLIAEPCLWIADTGDNQTQRDDVAIFVVPEPILSVATEAPFALEPEQFSIDESELVKLRIAYDEGPSDVEALAVEASGEAFWLFEKIESRDARVWRYLLNLDVISVDLKPPRQTLIALTQFSSPGVPIPRGRLITAADLSADGLHLILRVYTGVFEYTLPVPNLISALSQLIPEQIRLGPLSEPQGEALCYDDELNIWSASEANGSIQVLTQQRCAHLIGEP